MGWQPAESFLKALSKSKYRATTYRGLCYNLQAGACLGCLGGVKPWPKYSHQLTAQALSDLRHY